MKTGILIFCFLFFGSTFCKAQHFPPIKSLRAQKDSIPKRRHQYLGVQVNQLISQILNFGNTTTPVNNPYLLIYSNNSIYTGWGFNVGIGYTMNTTVDTSDPNTTRKTSLNDLSLRYGVERKFYLSKKWLASCGFDLLYSHSSDNTDVGSSFQFPDNSTNSKESINSYGFGPRLGLNYFISQKILIGTEATYYYSRTKTSQTLTVVGSGGQSSSPSAVTAGNFIFQSPLVLFLTVKMQ